MAALCVMSYANAQIIPDIYPWIPMEKQEIVKRIKYLSEDANAVINIKDIQQKNLHFGAKTKNQPWSGPYWALKQGMVANPYNERTLISEIYTLPNIDDIAPYKKRKNYILSNESLLTEKEIARLAPSEKYDLLLGNNLDLSTQIWDFINSWKSDMKWSFLRSIDVPEGHEIVKLDNPIYNWEGVCHGWAAASGIVPKPQKTVMAKLPDGRQVPFYPDDVKGLVSLAWANSLIQENVLYEGIRCNSDKIKKDEFGRYYDTKAEQVTRTDPTTGKKIRDFEVLPRCADMHPALMHLALVNLVGVQSRSLIADKSVNDPINNEPVAEYQFSYFNPYTGEDTTGLMIPTAYNASEDVYASSRHPETAFVLGVESKVTYVANDVTRKPTSRRYNRDVISKMTSLYDLELDAEGNIIGGQWRGYKDLKARKGKPRLSRPDFIWVIPKNYTDYFKRISGLDNWDIASGTPAPQSWKNASLSAHAFVFKTTKDFGNSEVCEVKNKETNEIMEVSCEFNYPRPQPLFHLLNELIEKSK